MAGSSIFENVGNPLLANYAPSLAASKTDAMLAKTDAKLARLDPVAAAQQKEAEFQSVVDKYRQPEGLAGNSKFGDLIDLGQASIYREGQNIANFATGQSNPELQAEADAATGVNPDVRARLGEATDSSIGNLADARINFREGNYLDSLASAGSAVGDILPVLPELAVDSLAGSIASGVAGTAVTAGVGSLPIALKKLARAGAAIDEIGDAVTAAVAAKDAKKKLNTVQKALAYTAEKASQTSFTTASILQQNEESYIEENGEPSSAMHKIVNAPVAIALNILDRSIFMSFLPSKAGAKAAASASKAYVKEVTAVLSDVPKKYSKQVAMRVLGASAKAGKVGGAEAVQEYLQTWHSILQAKMDDSSIRAALDQLRDEGNIDEANFSALVGAMVGGGLKVASQSPSLAAGVALDTAIGTASSTARVGAKVVKKAAEVVADSTTRAGLAVLSKDERAALSEQNKAAQKAGDSDVAEKQVQLDSIDSATTLEELKSNSTVAKRVESIQSELKITDEKMSDPKIMKAVKDRLKSELKGQQTVIKAAVYGSSKARVLKKVGSNVADKSVAKAQALLEKIDTVELVKKAIKITGDLSSAGVEAIKGIKSSTARGVLNMALTEGEAKVNTAVKAASDLDVDDLKKIVKVLKEKNPKLVPKFQKALDKKIQAVKNLGSRNDTLTTTKNIEGALKQIADGVQMTAKDAPKVFVELSKVIGGKIGDLESLEVVEAAMKAYKESAEFKAGTNKVSVGVLESILADQGKRIRKPLRAAAKAKVAEAVENVKDGTAEKAVTDAAEKAVKAADKAIDKVAAKVTAKAEEVVAKVKEVAGSRVSPELKFKRDKLASTLAKAEPIEEAGVTPASLVKAITKLFNAAEYKTLNEALAALNNFPALSKSDAILTAIKEAYPAEKTSEVMTETFDKEPSEAVNRAQAEASYKNLFPECPIK